MSLFPILTALSLVPWALTVPAPLDLQGRSPGGTKNVIIQMFQWNWDRCCFGYFRFIFLIVEQYCS
jgi:hypothetical protein